MLKKKQKSVNWSYSLALRNFQIKEKARSKLKMYSRGRTPANVNCFKSILQVRDRPGNVFVL